MRIGAVSPRKEAHGQMLERSPITTSPITCALGSMYADGATFGANPLKLRIMVGNFYDTTERRGGTGISMKP
jgi:hypothetical protein